MEDLRYDELNEYGEVLTDSNIAQFLATNNWTCQLDRKFDQVWIEPGEQGEMARSILLPRNRKFDDYRKRLSEAVEGISRTYDWKISQFAERVASVHADLFFVRIDQYSQDGTIPLKQASALLENLDQMIRTAAVTTNNPRSSGKGRIPELVNDFLNDDVRMGHTKKGSFIITVAARLDRPEGEEPPSSDIDTAESAISTDATMPSFTRRVMTTLARSIDVTRRVAKGGQEFVELDEAVGQGLRLPMVRALQDIGGSEGLRSLDLSFEWAAAEVQTSSVPEKVTLDRETIEALSFVEERLTKKQLPRRQTVIGPVLQLKRSEAEDAVPGQDAGRIIMRADVDGRSRNVTIPLAGRDYQLAIRSFREHYPVTATGEMVKSGNSWLLSGGIEMDWSFIEFKDGYAGSNNGDDGSKADSSL